MFKNILNRLLNKKYFSTAVNVEENTFGRKINAWQVHSYGDLSELQLSNTRMPYLKEANEVLVAVEAASVNPIDTLMLGGYGKTMMQIPRRFEMELPLTLGRDFCGTVINKGVGVDESIAIGDKVYGFIPVWKQGSFAEVIVAEEAFIRKQPEHLTPVESTSLVYASMTAWCALNIFATGCGLTKGQNVLILGASGGVGNAAVQIVKAQDCTVVATCSTDAVPLVQGLGADCVVDYTAKDYLERVANAGPYHIVLDCAKFGFDNLPPSWMFSTYVGLNSPLMKVTDKYGIIGGLAIFGLKGLKQNVDGYRHGKNCKWGFFTPSTTGFDFLDSLIKQQKLSPVIHKEFKFGELNTAFEEVSKGHLRGKVVINYT